MRSLFAICLTGAVLTACGDDAAKKVAVARATLEAKSGTMASGTATFTDSAGGVILNLSVAGLSPGMHAAHIHDVGDCSAADGTSAGGHWNPDMVAHGMYGTAPHHLGDLGNIDVAADGTGALSLTSKLWTINTKAANDVVGHSVIVHEKVDDFTTQPTGNAGARQACGVIAFVP